VIARTAPFTASCSDTLRGASPGFTTEAKTCTLSGSSGARSALIATTAALSAAAPTR